MCELEAYALLEHGQQHVEAAVVEAVGRALRCAVGCSGDERLCLDKEGAHALYGRCYGYAAEAVLVVGEEQFGGVAYGPEAVGAHLVDAELGGGTEAVFLRAQDAVEVVLVALELEHGVDDVFEHFGSGDGAFFVDVADENDARSSALGVLEQLLCAFANLCEAAG